MNYAGVCYKMNTIKTDKKIIAYGPGNITGAMSLNAAGPFTLMKYNNHITQLINNGVC